MVTQARMSFSDAVGVQRNLWSLEDPQQLGPAPMQAGQQPIQHDMAGAAGENPVEPGPQRRGPPGTGIALPGLQVGVEPPDQRSLELDGTALLIGGGHQLVDQPLGMDPAERVLAEAELAGIVGDDHRPGQQAMRLDRAPERALGGDPHRVGGDRQAVDAEGGEVRLPGGLVGKDLRRMRRQEFDHRPGQGTAAHIIQRRLADHVLAVPGAEQRQEGLARLRGCRSGRR